MMKSLACIVFLLAAYCPEASAFAPPQHFVTTRVSINRSIDASISHQRPQSLLFMALDDAMKSRLDGIRRSYQALTERLADPDVIANSNLLRQVMKDRSQSVDVVMAFDEYCRLETERQGAQELFQEAGDDAEMREMARSEMKSIESELDELETTIKILLLPKDPNDDRNCMLEIRAGTGGSEANIFAGKFKCCLGLRICDMRVCDMQYICTLFGNCS